MSYEAPVLTLVGAAQGLVLGSSTNAARKDSIPFTSRNTPEL